MPARASCIEVLRSMSRYSLVPERFFDERNLLLVEAGGEGVVGRGVADLHHLVLELDRPGGRDLLRIRRAAARGCGDVAGRSRDQCQLSAALSAQQLAEVERLQFARAEARRVGVGDVRGEHVLTRAEPREL